MSVKERFLKYVKIDTQSDPETGSHPSTEKQFDLANLLVEELRALGHRQRLCGRTLLRLRADSR